MSDRVALIDKLLRGKGRVTLALLVRELGVTERTVCRDLGFMKGKLGLPVAHTAEKGYHYGRQVPQLATRESVVGPMSRPRTLVRASHSRRILETIHEALYGRNEIWIESREAAGSPEPFIFHPFFFSKILGDLLLFGCRPADGILLNLPIRLLEDVLLTTQTFESPLAEGPKVRQSEGWAGKGGTHEVRLRFLPKAVWAEDLFFAENQILERSSSSLEVRFRTDDLARVKDLVLFLGEKVRLEIP